MFRGCREVPRGARLPSTGQTLFMIHEIRLLFHGANFKLFSGIQFTVCIWSGEIDHFVNGVKFTKISWGEKLEPEIRPFIAWGGIHPFSDGVKFTLYLLRSISHPGESDALLISYSKIFNSILNFLNVLFECKLQFYTHF